MKQNLTKVTKSNGARKKARLDKQQLALEIRRARPTRLGRNPHTGKSFLIVELVELSRVEAELRLIEIAHTRVEANKIKQKGQLVLRADRVMTKLFKWKNVARSRANKIHKISKRIEYLESELNGEMLPLYREVFKQDLAREKRNMSHYQSMVTYEKTTMSDQLKETIDQLVGMPVV